MKTFLTVALFAIVSIQPSYANGPTGTVGVDEKNLEELKKNKAVLDKQEQQSTEKIHEKQRDKYKVPGASERKDSPIFRPLEESDQ